MNVTKDNYEFLMFEMLEGNLNEAEKDYLIEEISKNAFYKHEWKLMQHTITTPDEKIGFADKQNLLKPEGYKIAFYRVWPIAKIAASLLVIGLVGFWYYNFNFKPITDNTPLKNNASSELKIIETPENTLIVADQLAGKKSKTNLTTQNSQTPYKAIPVAKPESVMDTVVPVNIGK